jgi:hypothetical protein
MRGYGVLMALGVLLGVIVGLFIGEPSAGALGGFLLGLIAAVGLWLAGR